MHDGVLKQLHRRVSPVDEAAQSPHERTRKCALDFETPEHRAAYALLHAVPTEVVRGSGLVVLPHTDASDELYDSAIAPALADNALGALRAADLVNDESVLSDAWSFIRTVDVIVVDLSKPDADTYYQLGLCHAWYRCPILITRDVTTLPPDLRSLDTVAYTPDAEGIKKLRGDLTVAIRTFLTRAGAVDPQA